jgi:FKBP-type peptidyl-prolyl cis-trans isomerase
MRARFRRFAASGQCLALALCMLGCKAKPVARDGYAGEPVRAAINASCTAELVDERGLACVQIDVFADGEGPAAARGEWVDVHYIVEVDGKPLDSSHDDEPLIFKLGESGDVIDGMHLGVEGMRLGERRRFTVPPKLGYRGQKLPGIPPKANLVFFVELMQRRTSL